MYYAARDRQQTQGFWNADAIQAIVEEILSQALRMCSLRQCRYIGLAKARLQMLSAIALNVFRAIAWLNDIPLARTR
ncbi:MAG: transposase [Myxacorys californica WJT36-NPBG1]|nr:transposase [Myxacorys californica WJT36-NPBG1]